MRRRASVVVGLVANACSHPPPPAPAPPPQPKVHLTDVQMECRAEESHGIDLLNARYGPTCNGPTMPVALDLFDLGSLDAEHQVALFGLTLAALCLCNQVGCDDALRSRAMADAASYPDRHKRDFNSAIAKIMDEDAAHSCLSGAVGAELYQAGFACAYTKGMSPPALRASIEELLATTFQMDRTAAAKLADGCAKIDGR